MTIKPVTPPIVVPENPLVEMNRANTQLDHRVFDESKAILKSNNYRTQRPSRRPQKSRGHGVAQFYLVDIGRKLKDKKEKPAEKPPAVQQTVAMPDFATKLLQERAECTWLRERLEGQSIVTRFLSKG